MQAAQAVPGMAMIVFAPPQGEERVLRLNLANIPENVQRLTKEVMLFALDRLMLNMDRFEGWDKSDDLSQKVVKWYDDFVFPDGPEGEVIEIDADSLEEIEEKMNQLDQILTSRHDGAPLRNPVLIKGSPTQPMDEQSQNEPMVWELEVWKDFMNSVLSQADGVNQLERVTVKVHWLAKAFIDWKNTVPFVKTNLELDLSQSTFSPLRALVPVDTSRHLNMDLLKSEQDPFAQMQKIFAVCLLESFDLQKRTTAAFRAQMREDAAGLEVMANQLNEEVQREVEKTKLQVEAHTEDMQERIQRIEQTHEEQVSVLTAFSDEQKKLLDHTLNSLEEKKEEIEEFKGVLKEQNDKIKNQNGVIQGNREKLAHYEKQLAQNEERHIKAERLQTIALKRLQQQQKATERRAAAAASKNAALKTETRQAVHEAEELKHQVNKRKRRWYHNL